MKTATDIAEEVFRNIAYLNIATVTKDHMPWNTAVWYAKDESYNLYFVSPTNTVHADNIKHCSECFVTVYDSTAPEGEGVGVYISGTVSEVKTQANCSRPLAVCIKQSSISAK